MNRRRFLQSAGLAGLGTHLIAPAAESQAAEKTPEPSLAVGAPVLVNAGPDRIDIVLSVNTSATGWVEFGETPALGQRATGHARGLLPLNDRRLAFQLTGLQPGRQYHYRVHVAPVTFPGNRPVRGEAVTSEIYTFRTLDPNAKTARFTVWNDTHQNQETLKALATGLQEDPADFLMWNGDVTNDIHEEATIGREFLNPAGQAFAARTPLFLGRGNHDVRGREARQLPTYVSGPAGQYYYAFRQGPVAAVVLDTGEDKPDEMPAYAGLVDFAEYRTQQQRWLEKAIEDPLFASAPFRVAFLHIPLVWDSPILDGWWKVWNGHKGWICEDGLAKWHDLLVKGRVDLVISGHTHNSRWFPAREDRPYGQLIGGGPKPEDATRIHVTANERELRFEMRKLNGEMRFEATLPARA